MWTYHHRTRIRSITKAGRNWLWLLQSSPYQEAFYEINGYTKPIPVGLPVVKDQLGREKLEDEADSHPWMRP